jgi:hypothetical protein
VENANAAMLEFAKYEMNFFKGAKDCYFIQHFGLLQHFYGSEPKVQREVRSRAFRRSSSRSPQARNQQRQAMPDGVHHAGRYVTIMTAVMRRTTELDQQRSPPHTLYGRSAQSCGRLLLFLLVSLGKSGMMSMGPVSTTPERRLCREK